MHETFENRVLLSTFNSENILHTAFIENNNYYFENLYGANIRVKRVKSNIYIALFFDDEKKNWRFFIFHFFFCLK